MRTVVFERVDGDDVDHGVRADRPCGDSVTTPSLSGTRFDQHGRGVGQEVEVGEVAGAGRAGRGAIAGSLGSAARRPVPRGRSPPPLRPNVVAGLGGLLAGLGGADGPRVEQQLRPVEHVAGVLLLAPAVEHVAVLVADVAAGQVHRFRVPGETPSSSASRTLARSANAENAGR